jgi:hypothetical protein
VTKRLRRITGVTPSTSYARCERDIDDCWLILDCARELVVGFLSGDVPEPVKTQVVALVRT